ncbi:MAG: hypothetical protein ABIC95_07120 [archaeon]
MHFSDKHPLRDSSIDEIRTAIYKAKGIRQADILFDHFSLQRGAVQTDGSAPPTPVPMQHSVVYDRSYELEMHQRITDTTKFAEAKVLHKEPVSVMGHGLLGYTFLGDSTMWVRDDLIGDQLHEVELHEAIHTPDEYETRRLTEWMLSPSANEYSQKVEMAIPKYQDD